MCTHTHTTEQKAINYGSHSCLDPKRHKEQSLPSHLPTAPLDVLWLTSAGGPSRAGSCWEEVSLNIRLLTREELYTREVVTLASEGRGARLGLWKVAVSLREHRLVHSR